jgi:hypothetical protein
MPQDVQQYFVLLIWLSSEQRQHAATADQSLSMPQQVVLVLLRVSFSDLMEPMYLPLREALKNVRYFERWEFTVSEIHAQQHSWRRSCNQTTCPSTLS